MPYTHNSARLSARLSPDARRALPLGLLLSALLAACSPQDSGTQNSGTQETEASRAAIPAASEASVNPASGTAAEGGDTAPELRLGIFPNVTHTAGLVAIDQGMFTKTLGDTKLTVQHFSNGSQVNEALASGAIDASYVGPGPAMNAFIQGVPLKIYAGAANGGAVLVARGDSPIKSVADLAGQSVAVPTRGSTQDINLRHLLHENNLKTDDEGGDVTVVPINPADMPAAFASGQVAAALVQEPWGAVLEDQGARLVVDEKGIWANGDYTSTVLVVNRDFAQKYPGTLRALLEGHKQAVAFVESNPAEAQAAAAHQIEEMTGKRPSDADLQKALSRTHVTWDINLDTLNEYAQLNKEAGFSRQAPDLNELVDLSVIKSLP